MSQEPQKKLCSLRWRLRSRRPEVTILMMRFRSEPSMSMTPRKPPTIATNLTGSQTNVPSWGEPDISRAALRAALNP
jgi:hypothetical protein